MDDFSEPDNDLERAIVASGTSPEDDPDGSARRVVLSTLALNTVVVLLKEPWEGEQAPDDSAEPMYVSDGENREQPMLAVFSSAERAVDFERQHGGFQHPCTVSGPWAVASAEKTAGIRINPNQALGFRIVPELAEILRDDIATAMERARERSRAEQSEP